MNTIIPTTILDGFFDDPHWVRKFALDQEYHTDPKFKWPGKRSTSLPDINPHLFYHTINKFLAIFYEEDQIEEWAGTACFQIVDGRYDQGWVHKDSDLISGVIYLNPNPPKKTGTMLYDPKVPGAQSVHTEEKMQFIADPENNLEMCRETRFTNNNQFETSVGVANAFNRLVAYDSHNFHSAMDFFGEKDDDSTSRLSLVFYISKLVVKKNPIHRMRTI